MNFNSLRDAYREEVIRTRRAFHAAPELSGHEWNTAERIRAILTGAGIPWEPCGKELPGTLVTIDGIGAGKTILLRADIDALPIEEKNDVPYKSGTKGVMHACGHDCHIAMLLAAAKILYEHRTVFPGRVKCIFQPAEENSRGALDMIAGGVLEGVDAAFGIHVASSVPSGKVSLRSGPSTAATDFFRITAEAVTPRGLTNASMSRPRSRPSFLNFRPSGAGKRIRFPLSFSRSAPFIQAPAGT